MIHSPVALAARRSNHVGDSGFRTSTETGAALTVPFGLYGLFVLHGLFVLYGEGQ